MEELLQELAEAELGMQVMVTVGAAASKRNAVRRQREGKLSPHTVLPVHFILLTLFNRRAGLQEWMTKKLICKQRNKMKSITFDKLNTLIYKKYFLSVLDAFTNQIDSEALRLTHKMQLQMKSIYIHLHWTYFSYFN